MKMKMWIQDYRMFQEGYAFHDAVTRKAMRDSQALKL